MRKKKFVQKERRAKRVKEVKGPPLLKKPTKYKIGDLVLISFLGVTHKAKVEVLEFRDSGGPSRWVYKCRDLQDGFLFPFVGILNTEDYCNIIKKL